MACGGKTTVQCKKATEPEPEKQPLQGVREEETDDDCLSDPEEEDDLDYKAAASKYS